ncbi:unnamed protein product [Polarella glacialis]|uniref:Chromo domain-containing protein n=1 Tax=Polarella glacialis TaxID=89957 RepID=A0A813FHF3_POLGL|nr:unnamed protein product [Polarella glacialis]CAE8727037.1 unnamed protein product [Polarella glacialis]
MAEEEEVFEVEDLLDFKTTDGRDLYLVKWKGFGETSWEPDENIGQELADLKRGARAKAAGGDEDGDKRKRKQGGEKEEKAGKKEKKDKKDKKKRRRGGSSEEKRRRRDSGSDSDGDEKPQFPPGMMPPGMMHPGMMPPGMMPPGMMPGMHGMPPPGMPGMPFPFPPDMHHGMMPPGMDGKGMHPGMMGKGMPGKGPMPPFGPPGFPPPGFGPPPFGPPGFPMPPFDHMGKGMMPPPGFKGGPPPMMMKGMGLKGIGKGPGFMGGPLVSAANQQAQDMQRFAVERKRRLRDFVGALRGQLAKDPESLPAEQRQHAKELEEALGLDLDGSQLPVLSPTELVLVEGLAMLWLFNPSGPDEKDRQMLLNLSRLLKVSGSRARQLLIKALKEAWPRSSTTPSTEAAQLFSSLAAVLPKMQPGSLTGGEAGGGFAALAAGMTGMEPQHPDQWRELITQIYAQYNPAKLADVPALLTKYAGRERTLYLGICEKYKIPATFQLQQPGFGGAPPQAFDEKKAKKYRDLICEIYKEHNPSKLNDVDALLLKYRGREELVYKGICEKYSVEPKLSKKEKKDKEKEDEKTTVEKFKTLISEVYAEHNKEKLSEMDDLMVKYKGKEKTLYLAVCHKYNMEPKLPGGSKKKDKKDDAEKAERLAKVKPLICEVYQEHNPSKIDGVDQLLAKYKGKEEQLYFSICEKYKVEPKIPKPDTGAPAAAPGAESDAAAAASKEGGEGVEVPKEAGKDGEAAAAAPADAAAADGEKAGGAADEADVKPADAEAKEAVPAVPAVPAGVQAAAAAAAATAKLKGLAGLRAGVASARGKGPVALKNAFADLIREVYKDHNPTKLETVDHLLEKYLGQEQDLYLTICKKYKVTPKDPEGLGDLEWMFNAQESLPRLLQCLVGTVVLHTAGLNEEDSKNLALWEDVRPRAPLCSLSHRFELGSLGSEQLEALAKGLHGDDSSRWTSLLGRCLGTEVKGPATAYQIATKAGAADNSSPDALTVAGDSVSAKGRRPFDSAVVHITDALTRAVRDCLDAESDDENTDGRDHERWQLPWSCEELSHVAAENGSGVKKEVGVEYRRGCWSPRKHTPMHAHSSNHSLCGPDVEGRLPESWRELADKLWLGILTLTWGVDVPLETVVVVQATGGHESAPAGASVVVTAPSLAELEQANRKLSPLLARVLSGMRANAVFAMHVLSMPQHRQPGRRAVPPGLVPSTRDGIDERDGAVSSDSSDAGDDDMELDEDIMSDAEPNESYRPLRLTRTKVRDAYLQGLLCLNCDAADHKHQDCTFRKKVCWNCHGNHPGNDCPTRCRFCRERHDYPLLECIKRICRRVNDWKKSKCSQEQRNVLATLEQLMIKLEGFEDSDLAKHNREVQALVKSLNEQGTLFPVDMQDVALSILDMKAPTRQMLEPAIPPPPPGAPPKPYVAPKLPKDPPPPMPENKYPWSEKIFLDELLAQGMYGSNVLSRIIGRGGMHHRRMESESGARVFFRGLGVSGRDMELTDPIDCRLHISVKGEVPQQGRSVRRIIKEIIAELDQELTERGEAGPALDNPRNPDAHPFGFMLPKGSGPESGEPLKFKFPEEDGQALNDMLVWLKSAKLPLELDSDTQWRTTLQVTPAEQPLPDDAPEEAEVVAQAFGKLISEWHHPSPYWFEEHDLRPTGMWSSLTAGEEGEGPGAIALQQSQGVRLSAAAVDHFSTLLEKSQLSFVPKAIIVEVLSRLRGVVRRQVEDEQLLLYLSYPWAWFAESMGRGLKLPYSREQVHSMLVDLGRVGGKPTESQVSPPFRGFSIEWLPIKAGSTRPDGSAQLAMSAPAAAVAQVGQQALPPMPANFAQAPLGLQGLPPIPQQMQQQYMPQATPMQTPVPPPVTPTPPTASSAPRGFCKYWLPDLAFTSRQDLRELIAGPGGAHFAHVLRKYPSVDLRVDGQSSLAAPPAHRMHVCMSSEDSEIFEAASTDVLDLIETVCDMVGEELGLGEDQVEGLIREIRAEKYFEAHGIRTQLPPTRPGAAPTPQTPAPATAEAADFEFVDEDMEMDDDDEGDDADTEDEDARTEASDAMSDITEDEGGDRPKGTVFDDI